MELKPGYKQTEVGVIPEDWEVKPAKQFGFPDRGGSPRPAGDPKYFNGSYIPWLTVAALTNIPAYQLVVSETATCLTEEGSLHSRTLSAGTLIIANSGATLGVAKILGITCCANDGIAALLNLSKHVSPHYLAYFINTKTSYLRDNVATGNGQPNLNTQLIGNFKVPLPPTKAEQRAIAEALSDVDALIGALDQLIAKKRDLKQAAMQQLLTGHTRLTGEWQIKRLGELCTMKSGEGITAKSIDDVSPYPCYGGNGLRGFTTRFTHEGDYCLIGRVGALCGNVLKVTGQFFASEHAIVVTAFDCVEISWLTLALGMLGLNRRAESSAQPVLTVSKLQLLEILTPLTKDEQSAIAQVLSDLDAEIEALKVRCEKTTLLKQGMMQELLTGKTRLV